MLPPHRVTVSVDTGGGGVYHEKGAPFIGGGIYAPDDMRLHEGLVQDNTATTPGPVGDARRVYLPLANENRPWKRRPGVRSRPERPFDSG